MLLPGLSGGPYCTDSNKVMELTGRRVGNWARSKRGHPFGCCDFSSTSCPRHCLNNLDVIVAGAWSGIMLYLCVASVGSSAAELLHISSVKPELIYRPPLLEAGMIMMDQSHGYRNYQICPP
ncbi:hypothetical protein AVEN_243592-1 [Araneus ventricosus]|uniref:Uncharacterized protein n=1 Tax=Araneus ventricosus TaxID=182803 RepID=A0A4Y2A650_ARAVE|nr:hypothetical protein AVEN_243592-1 [Araneus ventricosus]